MTDYDADDRLARARNLTKRALYGNSCLEHRDGKKADGNLLRCRTCGRVVGFVRKPIQSLR